MTERRAPEAEYEREVALSDYLEVLLKRKQLILGGALICALVAGLFARSQPQSYQTEALVVISPAITSVKGTQQQGKAPEDAPPPGAELMVPSLAPQAYEVLAKSDELMAALADTLIQTLDPALLEQLAGPAPSANTLAHTLSGALTVELLKSTEKAKSPLLVFRYQSSNEQLPVILVNLWTQLFLRRNQGLSSNVTDTFYQQVQVQYDKAKINLEQAETDLREVKAGYQTLNVVQTEINFKNTKLDSALKNYQQLQTEMEDKQRQLGHLDGLLHSLEQEGDWIGTLSMEQVSSLPRSAEVSSPQRTGLIQLRQELAQLTADSLALWQKHERQRQEFGGIVKGKLLVFEQEYQISQLRQQERYLDSTLTLYRQELAGIDQSREKATIDLQVIADNLAKTPRVLVVSKAVTDDALWNRVSEENKASSQKELGEYKLQSEELNPVYQELAAKISALQIQLDTYGTRKTYLLSEIPTLVATSIQVNTKMDSLKAKEDLLIQGLSTERTILEQRLAREKDAVQTTLVRKHQAFEEYRASYLTQKQAQEKLQRDLGALEEEVGFYRQNFEKWGGDLRTLANQADSLGLVGKRLERNIEIYKSTFTRFAQLREEAGIARQQAAGDIQVVSRATFSSALPRGTVKNMAIAGLVGLMAAAFLAFMLEYMQKARAQRLSTSAGASS